jgi:hypothetical protein
MNLTLSKEEAALLERILRGDLGDLKTEIGKTENYDWRVAMKQDEEMLMQIIERLANATAAAA